MWRFLGKLLLLGAARRWAKRPTAAVETAALALVFSERRLGRGPKRDMLLAAARVIFLPAALIKGVRLARRLAAGPKQGGRRGGRLAAAAPEVPLAAAAAAAAAAGGAAAEGDPLTAAAAAVALPTFRHEPPPLPRAVPRAQWGLLQIPEVAPTYAAWTRCLQNVLAAQGIRSLPPGFDPDGLELTRYLLYGGLLAASKPAEAVRAVAATAARVTGSLAWRAEYPFLEAREMQAWRDVVWWEGPDPDGTLWLHIHLARAVGRCAVGRGEGRAVCQAVISALEHGTRELMTQPPPEAAAAAAASGGSAAADGDGSGSEDGNPPPVAGSSGVRRRSGSGSAAVEGGGGGAGGGTASPAAGAAAAALGRIDDRIRVVIVGSGSNVRQALRLVPVLREFTRLVQRHYPGRLRAMYLVDMPRGLRMGLGALLNLLSQETRQKVKLCKLEDLPDCIAGPLAAQEAEQAQRAAQQPPGQQQQQPRQRRDTSWADAAAEDGVFPDDTYNGAGGGPGGGGAAGARLLSALAALWVAAAAMAAGVWVPPGPPHRPMGHGLGQGQGLAAAAHPLVALRSWVVLLLRVVPALLVAGMACLTYKSLLARL